MKHLSDANVTTALQVLIQEKVLLVHGKPGSGKSRFSASLVGEFIRLMKSQVVIVDLYKGAGEYRGIQGEMKFLTGREFLKEDMDPASVLEMIISDIEQKLSKTCTLYVLEESQLFCGDTGTERSLRLLIELVKQTNSCLLLVAQRAELIIKDLDITQYSRNPKDHFEIMEIVGSPFGDHKKSSEVKGQLFYLQDTRDTVGNSLLWWANNDSGYTCDIRCARVWTMDELNDRFSLKDTALPSKYKIHQKDRIDRLIQCHIDAQDIGKDGPHTLKHWGSNISDPEFSKDVQIERLRRALDHSHRMYSLHISTTAGNHISMVSKLKGECEEIINEVKTEESLSKGGKFE
ncbi:hypothetical protein [Bdellovibrio sp. BCCA]|uniref:hypothetical protein n=1 Tax=Bdellovibrio sp. BCCA TaxID=3136281 RepID=UPI0030F0AC41